MRTGLIAVAVAAAAFSVAAGGEAVVGAGNGPILFVGSRAENFQPEIYSVAADGSGRVNLSRDLAGDEQPAVSPDGARIAFVSHRDRYDAVYVMNADGGDKRRLVGRLVANDYDISGLTWSPTGRTLAFSAHSRDGIFCAPSSIYVVDLADGRLRRLTREGFGYGPTFSADGRFVAYLSGCGNVGFSLGVVRVDFGRVDFGGGGPVGVVDPEQEPSWAPRGHRLLYLRRMRNHAIRYLTTVDPAGQRRWVLRGVAATAPAWSPSGRLIAFFRPTGRRPGLYVVRHGTQRLRRLVTVDAGSSIAWSSNGAWLAFSAHGRTYFVRSSGRGLRRVIAAQSPSAWSPPPVWSRDSRRFAFVDKDGAARVVSPPNNSASTVTAPAFDAELSAIAWAAEDRLVFAGSNRRSRHLFAVEADGTGMRRVAPDGAPVGQLSPDGSRVAFVRDAQIWTARLDGSEQRQVTSDTLARDSEPAWAPDGQRIAFTRETTAGVGDIFVVDSAGGALQRLTTSPFFTARSPAWSPDAAWVAFNSQGGLFAVRPDGSGHHLIAADACCNASWSPDGTKLALGGAAIAIVNADGSGYRRLTGPEPVRMGQPAWSPDGTKIVFARLANPNGIWGEADSDLWTINLDGSGDTRLTDGPWPDSVPTWLPRR